MKDTHSVPWLGQATVETSSDESAASDGLPPNPLTVSEETTTTADADPSTERVASTSAPTESSESVAPPPESAEASSTETEAAASLDASAETLESVTLTGEPPEPPKIQRVLDLQHFNKALLEITPSSSETLGSLPELRKWNDEFGEGRKDRKRRQVWGKDR